jgi:hypothetical protein
MGLLVVAQQSWHRYRTNASAAPIRQNALNGPVWQSYYLTNIVDGSSPTICRDSLTNICYVFRCCACRRSSRTLIIVDRRSSVLEAFVGTIKKFCFGSWHYPWRLSVVFGGFLQQFFKDWNKIWCIFFAP